MLLYVDQKSELQDSLTLNQALDATILVPALPVSYTLFAYSNYESDRTRVLLYHSMPLQRRLSGLELPTSLSRLSSNPSSLIYQTYLAADQCCFQTLVSLPPVPSSAASRTTSRYLLRDVLFKASAVEDLLPWSLLSSRISFLSVSGLSTKP